MLDLNTSLPSVPHVTLAPGLGTGFFQPISLCSAAFHNHRVSPTKPCDWELFSKYPSHGVEVILGSP